MGDAPAGHRLFRQAGLYTFALMLLRAGNFLLVPLYTALLSTADYGRVQVAQQAGTLLATAAGCGLTTAVLRLAVDLEGDVEASARLRSTLRRFTAWAGAFAAGLAAITFSLWGPALLAAPFWPLGLAALVGAPFQALFVLGLSFRQVSLRAKEHTRLSLARWGSGVALALLLVLGLRFGAVGILAALSASFAIGAWLSTRGETDAGFDPKLLRKALGYGLPVLPHALAGVAMLTTDRALLAAHHGLEVAGIYALGVNLASAVFLVAQGTQSAWVPFFMREERDAAARGWQRVRRLSFFALLAVAMSAVGIGLFADEIIAAVAPDRYAEAADVVPRLAFANFVRAIYLVAIAVVLAVPSVSRFMLLATVPPALLNLFLNARWIPLHGVDGAVASAFVSYAVSAGIASVLSYRARQVPWKWGRGLVLLALVAIVLEAGRGEGLSVRLGLLMAFGLGSFGIDAHDLLRSASPWLRRLRGRPAL